MESLIKGLNFKKSNIRIWIHQRNLTNLQQVVWEGYGSKLLVEHSNNPKVKKFLEAVPHIMGLIKDIHNDVQNDALESLKNRLKPSVPPMVFSGKDSNGLTPLHKASGLGRQEIAEFIVEQYPKSIDIIDNDGRTPLHYAALLKDDGKMMNFLLENGADESILDNKQKTAAYYKTRSNELDSKLLNLLPECPRSAKESFAANWDWSILTSCLPAEELMKVVKKVENISLNDGKKAEEDITKKKEVNVNGNNEMRQEQKVEETEKSIINDNEDNKDEEIKEDVINVDKEENKIDENELEENTTSNKDNNEETNEMNDNGDDENEEETNDNNNIKDENQKNNDEEEEYNNNNNRPNSQIENDNRKSRPTTSTLRIENNNETSGENNEEQMHNFEVESVGVIEGIVNGEDEVETLNEEGQGATTSSENDNNNNSNIAEMVSAGNMEQLAALVLNGNGEKLMGQQSDNPELQLFLDNVPIYMTKINKIHETARNGSLRDLQAALDRRKFAIAKDSISPNGASPLHTAVVFGNTSIVRYLAGRFPETLQVTDDDGRTPLHYAAVLCDNGHYYNLLVHLGADTTTEDKFGNNPDYYRLNQNNFSHKSLLTDFGAEEQISDEILNDKVPNDKFTARKNLDDEDMLAVLERCYNVLHGRRNSNTISATSTISSQINNTTTTTTTTTPIRYSSLLCKYMKKYIFDIIKLRLTKLDHNLYDIIWPSVKKLPNDNSFRIALEQDFPLGIVAADFYVYQTFYELLEPIIKEYNCIDLHNELPIHVIETKFNDNIEIDMDLDPHCKWIISGKIVPSNGQVDMPFFATEEGRYLASTLGDPLIKGLTEVANKRPKDPIAYLATYLYNFANNRQQIRSRGQTQEGNIKTVVTGSPQNIDSNNAVPATIDVVTVEPDENNLDEDSAFNSTSRDEHGQSMLHFAAARAHGRNALFQLLLETEINIAYRDELYRTARDISIQANVSENTIEIDRYVLHIATKGDTDKLVELLLDGYDHITDVVDEDDTPIVEAVAKHDQPDTVSFLQSILTFEEKRERVHHAIRQGSVNEVKILLADENDTGSGKLLALGKNSYGRCTLHIAVLCQQEEIVDYLANTFSETLKQGDNLERTALHYAMGVEKMETISRVLIKAGSKRIVKDLKGRQPTYYYLNKSDILRLQEEEETF